MDTNRISGFLDDLNGSSEMGQGFIVNPFAASIPFWQIQIYQAAYQKAQQDLEAARDWPLAEWWN